MDAGSVKFSDRVLKTRIDCEIFTTPVIGLSIALVNPESHLLDKPSEKFHKPVSIHKSLKFITTLMTNSHVNSVSFIITEFQSPELALMR